MGSGWTVTRRRAMVMIGAVSGLIGGFPRAAFGAAPCPYTGEFGDFTVRGTLAGARIQHKRTYGGVTVAADVYENGTVLAYVFMVTGGSWDLNGQTLTASFSFDGGEPLEVKGRSFTQGNSNGRYHWVQFERDSNRRLFTSIVEGSKVDVEVGEVPGRDIQSKPGAFLMGGRNISLNGTAAAARFVAEKLAECRRDHGGGPGPSASAGGRRSEDGNAEPRVGAAAGIFLCSVTASCVGALRLDDDCFEMRTLRAYRDGVLARSEAGRALIADYGETSASLLRALDALPPAARDQALRAYYARCIVPAVLCIRLGLDTTAHRVYERTTLRLLASYAPHDVVRRRASLSKVFGARAQQLADRLAGHGRYMPAVN